MDGLVFVCCGFNRFNLWNNNKYIQLKNHAKQNTSNQLVIGRTYFFYTSVKSGFPDYIYFQNTGRHIPFGNCGFSPDNYYIIIFGKTSFNRNGLVEQFLWYCVCCYGMGRKTDHGIIFRFRTVPVSCDITVCNIFIIVIFNTKTGYSA